MSPKESSLSWQTDSESDTRRLGERLARCLVPGLMIALVGELGAGKTVLASGILSGAGAEGPFRSPTFTLVWEHQGRFPLYHVDLYRLSPTEAAEDLPWDRLLASDVVSVVEWADRLPEEDWPEDYVVIEIERTAAKSRRMKFTGRGRGRYCLPAMGGDLDDHSEH